MKKIIIDRSKFDAKYYNPSNSSQGNCCYIGQIILQTEDILPDTFVLFFEDKYGKTVETKITAAAINKDEPSATAAAASIGFELEFIGEYND